MLAKNYRTCVTKNIKKATEHAQKNLEEPSLMLAVPEKPKGPGTLTSHGRESFPSCIALPDLHHIQCNGSDKTLISRNCYIHVYIYNKNIF